jgi:hypothetical protein
LQRNPEQDFAATPKKFGYLAICYNLPLHNFLAPTLNQIDECAGEQCASHDANDDCGIHVFSPFS